MVLQDPGDEIIAHCASLKAGVAASVCLGDRLWAARDFPREYALASYLKEPLPHAAAAAGWLAAAADPMQPLTEEFVTHTAACVVELSRRAFVARRSHARGPGGNTRRGSGAAAAQGAASGARRAGDEAVVSSPSVAVGIRIRESSTSKAARHAGTSTATATPSVGSSSSSSASSSSAASSLNSSVSPAALPGYDGEEGDEDDEAGGGGFEDWGGNEDGRVGDGGDDTGGDYHYRYSQDDNEDIEGGTDGSDGSGSPPRRGSGSVDSRDADGLTPKEWLENFCGTNLRECALSPWEKVWVAVARVDSGTGQLLGQALGKGLDSIRTWLVSLVLYGPRAPTDRKMPRGSGDVFRAAAELAELCEGLHPRELGKDPVVAYVRGALDALAARVRASAAGDRTGFHADRLPSPAAAAAAAARVGMGMGGGGGGGGGVEEGGALTPLCGADIGVGRVIALHHGHNGWPAPSELAALRTMLEEAGFAVDRR